MGYGNEEYVRLSAESRAANSCHELSPVQKHHRTIGGFSKPSPHCRLGWPPVGRSHSLTLVSVTDTNPIFAQLDDIAIGITNEQRNAIAKIDRPA